MNYIFIPAGGLDDVNEPHTFVKKRLDKGIELYKLNPDKTLLIVLGGGTYHKPPPINDNGYVIHESTCSAKYLIKHGIDENKIIREWSSYDTIANGYYAFTNYIIPLGITNFTVITSDFHMERVKTIFNYFNKIIKNNTIPIKYISTPNSGINDEVLSTRIKREKNSNSIFKNIISNTYLNISDFTIWFYTKHNAYKSNINYVCDNKINKTY